MDLRLLCCLLISSIITNIKGSPSTSSDKPGNIPTSPPPPPAIVRFRIITKGQPTQECVCSGAAIHAFSYGSIVTSGPCVDKLTRVFGKKDTKAFAVWPDGTHHSVLHFSKFRPDNDGRAALIGMVIVKIRAKTLKKFALDREMPPREWQVMMAKWQKVPEGNHWVPVASQPVEGLLINDIISSLDHTTYLVRDNAIMTDCDSGSPLYGQSTGKINPTLFGIRINAQEYMNVYKFEANINEEEESLVSGLRLDLQ